MTSFRVGLMAAVAVGVASIAVADEPLARKPVADLPEVKGLANPFVLLDGSPVRTRDDWTRRREELKALFETYEYGHMPPRPETLTVSRGEAKEDEASKAVRQELDVTAGHAGKALPFRITLTLPPRAEGSVPVVIQGTFRFGPGRPGAPAKAKAAPPANRLALFTDRGYAVAEFGPVDFAPDNKDRARTAGVYTLFEPNIDCGGLMAWAWGISRVIDALEKDDRIDAKKIAVTGHSRYGKATLVAAAFDDRIALAVPSHSGTGGAAPYRFLYGKNEELHNVVGNFPYWFRPDFAEFVGHVNRLPIDQHLLSALVAPRALLATEGTQDVWINPQGSQLTHLAAKKVYDFLGAGDRISIRYRPVGHIPSNEDLLDFADHVFRGKPLPPEFGKLAYPEEPNGFDWDAPKGSAPPDGPQ